MMKGKPLYSSEIYQSPSEATLTIYKAKKAKLVYTLSSMHQTVSVDQSHPKKLPETVRSYNASKVGVDQWRAVRACKSCVT